MQKITEMKRFIRFNGNLISPEDVTMIKKVTKNVSEVYFRNIAEPVQIKGDADELIEKVESGVLQIDDLLNLVGDFTKQLTEDMVNTMQQLQ